MSYSAMTDDDLLALIAAYGANPDGWPEAAQDIGRAALASPSPVVAEAIAEAVALDAMLEGYGAEVPPAHLAQAILDASPTRTAPSSEGIGGLSQIWQRWRIQFGAAAASLTLGLGVGFGAASATSPAESVDSAVYSALGFSSFNLDLLEDVE